MSSAINAPEEIWSLILAKLPWRDRFRSCSRVCSKLHRANAAATTKLQLTISFADCSRSAELYLANHGHYLTALEVSYLSLVQLPCTNLKQLQLYRCTVQLGPSSNNTGILAACEGLTKLEVPDCKITDSASGLSALAAVPNLQHLKLGSLSSADGAEVSVPSSLLLHVPKLTHLHLESYLDKCLLQLSSLTDLQSLTLTDHAASSRGVSPSTAPGFSFLAALTSIDLRDCRLDPVVLQDSTQLQSLTIRRVTLISDPDNPSAASAMLLSCIARMARLERLFVSLKETHWTDDIAAYRALTASSALHTLSLEGEGLPGGIWQAVFPADRTCPNLQVVHGPEWTYTLEESDSEDDEPGLDHGFDEPKSAATAADLARLASCCSALQTCRLCIAEDASLAPLAQLTTLRNLNIDRVSNGSICSLPALTQLGSLCVKVSGPVMPRHILALTALQQLRLLYVDTAAVHDEELAVLADLCDLFFITDPQNPDVWLKLLKACARTRACQPLVTDGLLEQVASQQQQLAQQQQLSAQQQQLSTQQQAQISKLQEQLAAASALATQAAERLQALEGQVQQLMQALQHGST